MDRVRFGLRHLLLTTTLFGVSAGLIASGMRVGSVFYGYGIFAGALLVLFTVLFVASIVLTRPGAAMRVLIAIVLIILLLSPLLFPPVL